MLVATSASIHSMRSMPHYKKFSRLAEKTTYIPRDQFVQVAEALKESLACYLSLMFLSGG
jgi:hypothetical protein